jgi:thioesterase domain-containing protein/acyl carrier protein
MLAELPLTRNNKLDRRALPEPGVAPIDRAAGFVGPRSDTELQLAAIWEELLGVAPIGVRDNFFDLGGHSLLAVQLVSRVSRRFGRELPLAALLTDGTIEQMAVLIDQTGDGRPWSPLVPIRPHGTLAPLFCIHPAGGNVLGYHELAQHVGSERPVYAIQARGVDGLQKPHATFDAMLGDYLAAIRAVQPAGPYHLLGWSSGGVLAYEIARRLAESGETVAQVSLIDSRVMSSLDFDPDDESRILVTLADFLERFYGFKVGISYDELEALDREARLARLLEQASIAGHAPLDLDAGALRTFLEVARENLKLLKDYQPPPSDLPVRLYRVAERAGEQDDDLSDDLGWSEIVGRRLAIEHVSGDHITVMTGDHARRLAAAIEASLS